MGKEDRCRIPYCVYSRFAALRLLPRARANYCGVIVNHDPETFGRESCTLPIVTERRAGATSWAEPPGDDPHQVKVRATQKRGPA